MTTPRKTLSFKSPRKTLGLAKPRSITPPNIRTVLMTKPKVEPETPPKVALVTKPKEIKKPKPAPVETPPQKKAIRPTTIKAQALLKNLLANHPGLFPADGKSPQPWAINIHKQIQARYQVSKRVSKLALKTWRSKNNIEYHDSLIVGGSRYNLDGEPIGEVTKEHQEMAERKIQAIQTIQAKTENSL